MRGLLACAALAAAAVAAGAASAPAKDPFGRRLLTPMLEAGASVESIKAAAEVKLPGINITSYAGYFNTNATDDTEMFMWMFEAASGQADAPLVVWMQGGPGASSLFALFTEIGPYRLDQNLNPVFNPATWCLDKRCLFLDNPRGTGYSSTAPGTLCTEASCYGADFDSMLRQALSAFGLEQLPVYITGESYGGHYVPEAAATVLAGNAAGKTPAVQLAGIYIGNGFSDPPLMVQGYPELMFNTGLIDDAQLVTAQSYVANISAALDAGDMVGSYLIWDAFINGDSTPGGSWFENVTGLSDYFNIADPVPPPAFGLYAPYVTSPLVRAAIGVGSAPYADGNLAVELALKADVLASQKPHIGAILEAGVRVLIANGVLDIICGAPLTERYLPTIPWSGIGGWVGAQRSIWSEPTTGIVAGYVRSSPDGALTFAAIRGAGHISPYDQPWRSQDLIGRFVNKQPF